MYLRLSEEVLADQVPDLLKTWRGIIFDHAHLRAYDEDPRTREVDKDYTQAVAKRFGQWVLDTARAKYDQAWLDYQYEIGLRHHRSKKNKTDNGHTLNHIRGRDLLAFCAAIVVPMRPFLAKKGHSPEVVNRMYDAWMKSMILQATLWVQPYMRQGDFWVRRHDGSTYFGERSTRPSVSRGSGAARCAIFCDSLAAYVRETFSIIRQSHSATRKRTTRSPRRSRTAVSNIRKPRSRRRRRRELTRVGAKTRVL